MMTAEDAGRSAGASATKRRARSVDMRHPGSESYGGNDRAERGPVMIVAIRTRTWHWEKRLGGAIDPLADRHPRLG